MNKTIKKLFIILLLTIQVGVQSVPVTFAEEAEAATEGSLTTSEQTTPQDQQQAQQEQTQQTQETQQAAPSPTPSPYVEDETDRAARLYREQLQREIQDEVDAYLNSQGITPPERNRIVTPTPTVTDVVATTTSPAGSTPSGVGDVEIETGDATNSTQVTNAGNNNLAGSAVSGTGATGATVANTANGTSSANSGSAVVDNSSDTNQINSATVNTNLNSSTVTGDNTASNNVGDSSIDTGDANTTGTVLTMVNTNATGVMVSEFNVIDDQVGDVILDFAAGCVLGCGGPTQVVNTGNGSNSTNDASVDTTNSTITTQDNDAQIGNDLVLTADTGNNTASRNTGGDSNITTGDANVAANVLTFANNNIAGNVIYGIVNIFGDLIGDIIFPEDQLNTCCAGSVTAKNTGNGSNSTNSSDIDIVDSDNTFQSNTADINNTLVFDANTGENTASRNTGGDSSIDTGDTSVDVNLLNIANTNLIGGNWWIVMVNDIALGWVGKIMGSPDDSFFAGSEGSDFQVDENGFITATNNKNGTGTTNDASVSQTNTDVTKQTNNADIDNNLKLTANTGNNETGNNTGGDSKVKTGDATIVANMINFVNNNIKGNGKVFVTVVNVFGTWLGDFVSPGQKKQGKATNSPESNDQANNAQNETDNGGDNNDNNGSNAQNTQTQNTNPQHNGVTGNRSTNNSGQGNSSHATSLSTKGNSTVTSGNGGTAVLGQSTQVSKISVDKMIKINFAWLLLALPFIILIKIRKKVKAKLLSFRS